MYYRNDQDQLSMEEFSLPFGGRLLWDNRWVRPVEGRNGNAKRRFGLDRLFSKLDETAKTEAALILLCHERLPSVGPLACALFPEAILFLCLARFFSRP